MVVVADDIFAVDFGCDVQLVVDNCPKMLLNSKKIQKKRLINVSTILQLNLPYNQSLNFN